MVKYRIKLKELINFVKIDKIISLLVTRMNTQREVIALNDLGT